jgi:hypothetical protein
VWLQFTFFCFLSCESAETKRERDGDVLSGATATEEVEQQVRVLGGVAGFAEARHRQRVERNGVDGVVIWCVKVEQNTGLGN